MADHGNWLVIQRVRLGANLMGRRLGSRTQTEAVPVHGKTPEHHSALSIECTP